MPELPSVEIFRQYIDATCLNKKISKTTIKDGDMLKGVSRQKLQQRLHDNRFRSTHRHGKYLFAQFGSSQWLVLHFGMTGFIKYYKNGGEGPDHVRMAVNFVNGYRLAYSCQRKLGRISYTESIEDFIDENKLGPDCASDDFGLEDFSEALGQRSGAVKTALMNQSRMAGLGNVYSDEVLFQVGIHPRSEVKRIDSKGRKGLYRAMKSILRKAIDCRAEADCLPSDYLINNRREKVSCPHCGGTITKIKVSGRSTCLCKDHQKLIQ